MPRKSLPNFASVKANAGLAEAQIAALTAGKQRQVATRSIDIPIARIRPNPFQARTSLVGLEELASAIREQGFTTRLRVRHDPADERYYQLVFGERRLRAAELAGLTEVPCDVAEHTDDDLIEIGLTENIQREDLDPLEEARAFKAFIEQRGYTQQHLAERIGKDAAYVSRRLKLLTLPGDVQQLIGQRGDTVMAALEIARLPAAELRQPLIEQVARGELTKRDIEARVREFTATQSAAQVGSTDGQDHVNARSTENPTIEPVLPAVALSFDRDMRVVKRIFATWQREVQQLDAERRRQLAAFTEAHLDAVQQLKDALSPQD